MLDQLLLLVLARQDRFCIGIVTLYGNESIGGTFDRAVLIVDFLHFNIELLKTAIFIVELRQLAFVLIDGGLGGLRLGALPPPSPSPPSPGRTISPGLGRVGVLPPGLSGGVLPPPPPQAVNMEIAMAAVSRQAAAFLYSFML